MAATRLEVVLGEHLKHAVTCRLTAWSPGISSGPYARLRVCVDPPWLLPTTTTTTASITISTAATTLHWVSDVYRLLTSCSRPSVKTFWTRCSGRRLSLEEDAGSTSEFCLTLYLLLSTSVSLLCDDDNDDEMMTRDDQDEMRWGWWWWWWGW